MSFLIYFTNIAAFAVIVAYIWLHTDAFVEYLKLFNIKFLLRWFRVEEYDNAKYNDITMTYPRFLKERHNSFFKNAITCPVCLIFWIVMIMSIIHGVIAMSPLILLLSWMLYYLLLKLKG